jgi:hypothetical protein
VLSMKMCSASSFFQYDIQGPVNITVSWAGQLLKYHMFLQIVSSTFATQKEDPRLMEAKICSKLAIHLAAISSPLTKPSLQIGMYSLCIL